MGLWGGYSVMSEQEHAELPGPAGRVGVTLGRSDDAGLGDVVVNVVVYRPECLAQR